MIARTFALALRTYPFRETSRIAEWLTPGHGRITTLLKGAHRPRSIFFGEPGLYGTSELLFYTSDRDRLLIARECSAEKERPALRTDWRACAVAGYLADLALRIVPPHHPDPGLFGFFDAAFDRLAEGRVSEPLLFWLEFRLLRRLGLAPHLHACAGCGVPAGGAADPGWRFSATRGGLLCPGCSPAETSDTRPAARDVLAMLRSWESPGHPDAVARLVVEPPQRAALRGWLGDFLAYHLDLPPASRQAALRSLAYRTAA